MCGIIGAVNRKDVSRLLMGGLKRMQSRGYDGWGLAIKAWDGSVLSSRHLGVVDDNQVLKNHFSEGRAGIGHTRWSSHGEPSLRNTHPIRVGNTWVVHNGVIDNYQELSREIGHEPATQTDSEVIAALFDRINLTLTDHISPYRHFLKARKRLRGQYAFALVSQAFPGVLAACSGSPLWVSREGFIASEIGALTGLAAHAIKLPDNHMIYLDDDGIVVFDDMVAYDEGDSFWAKEIPVPDKSYRAQGFPVGDSVAYSHSMLAEIGEQPELVRGFITAPPWSRPLRTTLFGCGSSYHAALLGASYIRRLAGLPAVAAYAVELTDELVPGGHQSTTYVALTQSGETRDTLLACETILKQSPANLVGITNGNSSTLTSLLSSTWALGAGEEIGVAATKTFTLQAISLLRLAGLWGGILDNGEIYNLQLWLAGAMGFVADRSPDIYEAALRIARFRNLLYLGRDLLYPVALEGALKMKEIAYIHAEGMHASEIKHGPIALIDADTACVFLVCSENTGKPHPGVLANINQVKARNGFVLAVADQNCAEVVRPLADVLLTVPNTHQMTAPLLINVVLQLLAYYAAVSRGINPDRPRGLSKAVTIQ